MPMGRQDFRPEVHLPHQPYPMRRHRHPQCAAVFQSPAIKSERSPQREHHERRRTAPMLERRRSSDTVILLMARSRRRSVCRALREIEGAFSLVVLAEDRIISSARDGEQSYVFASKNLRLRSDRSPSAMSGEMVIVGPSIQSAHRRRTNRAASSNTSRVQFHQRPVQQSREQPGDFWRRRRRGLDLRL